MHGHFWENSDRFWNMRASLPAESHPACSSLANNSSRRGLPPPLSPWWFKGRYASIRGLKFGFLLCSAAGTDIKTRPSTASYWCGFWRRALFAAVSCWWCASDSSSGTRRSTASKGCLCMDSKGVTGLRPPGSSFSHHCLKNGGWWCNEEGFAHKPCSRAQDYKTVCLPK
jgi:hypothetical protein